MAPVGGRSCRGAVAARQKRMKNRVALAGAQATAVADAGIVPSHIAGRPSGAEFLAPSFLRGRGRDTTSGVYYLARFLTEPEVLKACALFRWAPLA